MATNIIEDTSAADYVVLRGLLCGILEENLNGAVPEPKQLKTAENGLTDAHRRWLMLLDLCAAPEQLRIGVQKRSPPDESLIVLLRFLYRLGRDVDHDRFDWVITYMFKRRLEAGNTSAIGQQITEMLPEFPQPPLSATTKQQIAKLGAALQQINTFTSFAELTQSGLIAKGREIKESFGDERFHPAVLGPVVNYNLVLGKAFKRLFDEAAVRSRDLASKLSRGDYRSNVDHLRRLAEAPAVAVAVSPEVAEPAAESMEFELEESFSPAPILVQTGVPMQAAVLEGVASPAENGPVLRGPMSDPLKDLGLDEGREEQRVRFMMRSLIAFFELEENRTEISAKIGNITMTLTDWEARSLQTNYPDDDKSFRAEFARMMKQAVSLMMRMSEELDMLGKKSSSEYLWKPHYDALVWLFARGRQHASVMEQFAEATRKRGLPEKQQQVAKTATRVVAALEKVAKSF